ncbi:MAG: hypothetical protein H7322_19740, partial [Ramlibacter sp.]|nr:hypothetical protein [Ramlibacter sp.]
MSPIQPGVIAAPSGLEKEAPEFAEDDDIPSDHRFRGRPTRMNGEANAPVPSPPPPDTSTPEPIPATPGDPEKGRVPVPAPGKPEHPKE